MPRLALTQKSDIIDKKCVLLPAKGMRRSHKEKVEGIMKKKQEDQVRLKGQLRLYMQLPMVMAILLIAVNIWIFSIDRRAGMVMFIFVIVYIGMIIFLYLYGRAGILKDLVEFAAQYGIVQNRLDRKSVV